jgi:hypothetical protein
VGPGANDGTQTGAGLPLNQAVAVWQSITRTYRNGRYVGTRCAYTLRLVDGYQLKLNLHNELAI